ncbi:MAG: RNase H family protein [Cetobacterium sp.]
MNKFRSSFRSINYNLNKICIFDTKDIIWFTDGSCAGNGKKCSVGGFAAVCTNGPTMGNILYKRIEKADKPTNIRAEGFAIQTVFEKLIIDLKSDNWNSATIYSDSEFWIKMLYTYMPKWKEDMFNSKANPDITKKIWQYWNHLQKSNKKIEILHIYAHNKDNSATSKDPFKRYCHDNNKLADELANIARSLPDYKLYDETIKHE